MKCVAIDDEPMALAIIAHYCQNYPEIDLRHFTDPLQGIKALQEHGADVVFLDIEMNEHSGIEMAKQLPAGTLLVFTTAYENYALMGFELNAIDYLHKPISMERFDICIQRVKKALSANQSSLMQDSHITVSVNYKKVQIPLSHIAYIESLDNYMHIHLVNGQSLKSKQSMRNILAMLPAAHFLRIHRSFIIANQHLHSFTKQDVLLKDEGCTTLPIGRKYAKEFARRLLAD